MSFSAGPNRGKLLKSSPPLAGVNLGHHCLRTLSSNKNKQRNRTALEQCLYKQFEEVVFMEVL